MMNQKVSDFHTAKRALINAPFFDTQKYTDQQLRAVREHAHPEILEFERKFQAKMKKLGIPMFCHSLWRTWDEQKLLFRKGVTKAMAGQSPHNFGMAIDMVHSIHAWNVPDRKCWDVIGHVGKQVAQSSGIKIEWGGDWKFYDPAHWEIEGWKDRMYVDHGGGVKTPHLIPAEYVF